MIFMNVGSIMLHGNVLHAATAETVASFFWRHWPEKHVWPIDDMIDHSYGCGRGLPQDFFPPTLLTDFNLKYLFTLFYRRLLHYLM